MRANPYRRHAYLAVIADIDRAPTLEALDAVLARSRSLAQDQGRADVDRAARRRRVELAILEGEAVGMRDHLRALERARVDERSRILAVLGAIERELKNEAGIARGHGRTLEAAGKAEHATLIRRAARRCAGPASGR